MISEPLTTQTPPPVTGVRTDSASGNGATEEERLNPCLKQAPLMASTTGVCSGPRTICLSDSLSFRGYRRAEGGEGALICSGMSNHSPVWSYLGAGTTLPPQVPSSCVTKD